MTSLTGTLSIPNSVVEFEGTSLNTLILGSGLKSVGRYAFNLAPLSAICTSRRVWRLDVTRQCSYFRGARLIRHVLPLTTRDHSLVPTVS